MIDLIELTNAHVDAFRRIPELVQVLADQDPLNINGYVDMNPNLNSSTKATYQIPPGYVLVMWQETVITEGESMSRWTHRFRYFLRATRTGSTLDMLHRLMNGVPDPGDGQCWRLCGLMAGVDPVGLMTVERIQDQEGVDFLAVLAEIPEIGDAGIDHNVYA